MRDENGRRRLLRAKVFPLSFSTLGAIEPQGKALFAKLRKLASTSGLDSDRVNFIQDVLSVQLVRAQARRLLIGGASLEPHEAGTWRRSGASGPGAGAW